ncbi:MAG: hypothetical protein V8Q17_01605 [Acutalibacteraceae bacterium]
MSEEQTETAQKIEQPIEMSEVAKETTDAVQNETSQAEQLSGDVPLEQPEEMPQASSVPSIKSTGCRVIGKRGRNRGRLSKC